MKYDVVRIKTERVKKGWTQTRLAKAIGAHPSTISLIESGKIDGLPGTIKDIADVLGLRMDDIILLDNGNAA